MFLTYSTSIKILVKGSMHVNELFVSPLAMRLNLNHLSFTQLYRLFYLCISFLCKFTINKHAILSNHEKVSIHQLHKNIIKYSKVLFMRTEVLFLTYLNSIKIFVKGSMNVDELFVAEKLSFYWYNIYIFTDYSNDNKFILPLDSNYSL